MMTIESDEVYSILASMVSFLAGNGIILSVDVLSATAILSVGSRVGILSLATIIVLVNNSSKTMNDMSNFPFKITRARKKPAKLVKNCDIRKKND